MYNRGVRKEEAEAKNVMTTYIPGLVVFEIAYCKFAIETGIVFGCQLFVP
jgi:hypothetical protein